MDADLICGEYDINRFWSKVDILSDEECWIWKGSIDGKGYGAFYAQGQSYIASRVAYMYSYGKNPEGMLVCHSCDNPPCVNPKHLFLGTSMDNMLDKIEKGRGNAPRGERQTHKLTENDVIKIREMSKTMSQAEISKKFGVSFQHISDIVHRKKWAWLGEQNVSET